MMLPPIPYNGVLRPLLMLIGMAMMFLLLQRTQKKPCRHRKPLWAATLLSRTAGKEYSYRVEPLITLRLSFFANGTLELSDPKILEGIVVNLLLMVPVGYMLPQLFNLSATQTTLLGAGLSLSIESIQLITRLGMFELDDFIYNTLGAALGYWLLVCMEKHTGAQLRR